MIQVVKRVAEILAVIEDAGGLPLREIAGRTGLRKTTAGNLVRSLLAVGLLEQDESGRYAVGPALRRLGWEGPSSARLAELAAGSVRALSDSLDEGVVGVRLAGPGLEVLAEATPDHALVVNARVLREVSPYMWATGRALLAAQPGRTPESLVAQYGAPDRDWPEAQGAGLAAELSRIRRQGWAQRLCAHSGVHSLARAILDPFGRGLLAFGVYVPASRCGPRRRAGILQALTAAAERLSAELAAQYGASSPPRRGQARAAAPGRPAAP